MHKALVNTHFPLIIWCVSVMFINSESRVALIHLHSFNELEDLCHKCTSYSLRSNSNRNSIALKWHRNRWKNNDNFLAFWLYVARRSSISVQSDKIRIAIKYKFSLSFAAVYIYQTGRRRHDVDVTDHYRDISRVRMWISQNVRHETAAQIAHAHRWRGDLMTVQFLFFIFNGRFKVKHITCHICVAQIQIAFGFQLVSSRFRFIIIVHRELRQNSTDTIEHTDDHFICLWVATNSADLLLLLLNHLMAI